jgi:26S proteasome regulatory subunit (ATPase 3-interacting protein)
MQKHKIPKSKVDKTLAKLSSGESPAVTCKEFGKTKVYFISQEGLPTLSDDEIKAKNAEITQMKSLYDEKKAALGALRFELRGYVTKKTVEELHEICNALEKEDKELDIMLKGQKKHGAVEISKEDMEKVENDVRKNVVLWRKRKRSFEDIWGTVNENIDVNKREVWEKIGIETDDDGADGLGSLNGIEQVLNKKQQRK